MVLETALVNLTRKCNLSCKHCYISAGFPLKDELTFRQMAESFKKLHNWGVKTIILLGGEPFIRQRVLDLILIASELFENVHIETNGMVFPINIVEYIKSNQINNLTIFVSIEDSNIDYNDDIRGEGHLEQAIVTIKSLKRAGVKVAIRSTLFSDNDYKGLINLAGELGVEIIFVRFLEAGRGKELGLMPNKERLKEFYEIISKIDHVRISDCPYYIWDVNLLSRFKDKFEKEGGICQVLRKSRFLVDSNGDIYPCNMLIEEKYKLGNILRENKADVLRKYDKIIEKWKKLKISDSCKKCKYLKICNGGCAYLAFQNKTIGDDSCFINKSDTREVKMEEDNTEEVQEDEEVEPESTEEE